MAVSVEEILKRRGSTGVSAKREYWIRGVADDTAAYAALLAEAPLSVVANGRTLSRYDKECGADEFEQDIYVGTALYRTDEKQPAKPGSFTVSVDVSGQNTHITQAIKHRKSYALPNKFARFFGGAINVTSNGIEGTDIIVPAINYVANYTFPSEQVTDDYIRQVAQIVGTMNSGPFRAFDRGELLLIRVSGQQRARDDGNTDVSYAFAVSFNERNLKITGQDGTITVKEKLGWDYLWVRRESRAIALNPDQPDKKTIIEVPIEAHVEQVYKETDYDNLGLPVL